MPFKLQDELMNATSRNHIAGVYWSSRDMGPGPLGNHHFFTFVYTDEEQARRVTGRWKGWNVRYHQEVNDSGLVIFFTTVGVDQDSNKNIVYKFNPESDLWSINEIAKEGNTDPGSVDWDLQAHRISHQASTTHFASYEALMDAILEKIFNFKEQREIGNTVPYTLRDENCAAGVNSVLASLGYPEPYRTAVGEFSGIDWGEEDIIPASLYRMNYVGNKKSLELHSSGCEYVARMHSENKENFTSIVGAMNNGYNGCAYCLKEFDTDTLQHPQKIFKLHLIGLACKETEDFTGADSAYLRVNGIRVWGPVRMNNGDAKTLTDVPPIEFSGNAKVALFDKDSGASIDYYVGNQPLDEDDELGVATISSALAGAGEKSYVFNKDGANYTLICKVVEYDVNTGTPVPATSYELFLESLTCFETEDFTGADETYLLANNMLKWGPKSMNDGDTKDLSEIGAIEFHGSVRLDLYDQDGSIPSDDDDHLGHVLITPSANGLGTQGQRFKGDGAHYLLKYHVGQRSTEDPINSECRLRLISLKCHETEDVTGSDHAYLHVNNILKWGPRAINNGQTRDLTGVEPISFRDTIRIDLYDEDTGSWFDEDDHIDKEIISKADANLGVKERKLKGDGASYTLKYEVLL